jgi:hypothetical protein
MYLKSQKEAILGKLHNGLFTLKMVLLKSLILTILIVMMFQKTLTFYLNLKTVITDNLFQLK